MIKNLSLLCLILFAFVNFSVVRAQNNSLLALANKYSVALKNLERQKAHGNVANVYRQGQAAAGKLGEIENLNEADYALLAKRMRGYDINRNEILYIEPDSKFFKALSKKYGTPTDLAFFSFLAAYKPEGVFPAYTEMQTDVTGCTIYGTGKLTELYGKAKQFKKQHPNSMVYQADIDDAISAIKNELTESTCACGNANSLIREFRLFIKAFPTDQITPAVRKRMLEIQKNKSEIRFNCQSG